MPFPLPITRTNFSLITSKLILTTLYAFFWVIPRHLKFICERHFGTLCLFHLHRRVGINRKKAYNIQNKAKI